MSEASSTAAVGPAVPSSPDEVAMAVANDAVLAGLDCPGYRLRRPRPSPPGDAILSN